MEASGKIFGALWKKSMLILCNIQKFWQVFAITILQIFIFQKDQSKIYFGVFTKCSMQL